MKRGPELISIDAGLRRLSRRLTFLALAAEAVSEMRSDDGYEGFALLLRRSADDLDRLAEAIIAQKRGPA